MTAHLCDLVYLILSILKKRCLEKSWWKGPTVRNRAVPGRRRPELGAPRTRALNLSHAPEPVRSAARRSARAHAPAHRRPQGGQVPLSRQAHQERTDTPRKPREAFSMGWFSTYRLCPPTPASASAIGSSGLCASEDHGAQEARFSSPGSRSLHGTRRPHSPFAP